MIAGPHLTFEYMQPIYTNEEDFCIRNPGKSITFVYKDQSVLIMDQKEEQEKQEKLEELSPEKQRLMDNYHKNTILLDQIKELNENWKKVGDKKDAIGHSKKDEKTGLIYSRGEAKVNASVGIVIDLLTNPEKNDVTNPGVKVEKVLMQLTDEISLHYDVSGVPLIDDRYSVFVVGNEKKEDGTLALYVISSDYDDIQKPKNAVRCEVKQAWYIKKINNNETNIIQLSCIDPGGKIPDFIKSKIINKRGLEQVQTVKNYCEKEVKKQNKKK